MTSHADVRRCTVYTNHGDGEVMSIELGMSEAMVPRRPTIADRVSLLDVMSRDLICARPQLDIVAVIALMMRHHVGCVPVVDERRHPVGVITKSDLVEQLAAAIRAIAAGEPLPTDLVARNAEDVMMPFALALDEHATVAHAASMMASEDTHHVLVVREGGELVGVVSSKDIVDWLVSNDGLAPGREVNDPCVPPPWQPLDD